MIMHAVYSHGSSALLPLVRSGRQASCTCCAKKKSKPKSKRGLKRQDAVAEPPTQPKRTLERQDAFAERSFASMEPPDVTTQAVSTQPERTLRRQDAFNERTLKTWKPEDSTAQKGPAPKLERENVLTVCRVTSIGMAVIGVLATIFTPTLLQKAGSGIQSISQDSLLHVPDVIDIGIGVAAGCFVTAARFVAMQNWEDLAASTNAANSQVLRTDPEMEPADIAFIACLPAVSEEILFRGAVVGNLGGGAGAVVLVALIFGYLHVSGPRNYASGIFAAVAGVAYGMVYIYSASVLAAALAHCVGNLSSASVWLATSTKKDSTALANATPKAD